MEKPKFTIREYLEAFNEGIKEKSSSFRIHLLSVIKKPTPKRVRYLIDVTRLNLNKIILEKRLPFRNEDGSMNWPNYFAVQMGLGQPVKRSDIFPEGTDQLSKDDLFEQSYAFLKPLSSNFNFIPATTAYDPVELPEVIDKDFRPEMMKVNQLDFIRCAMGCSGHAEEGRTGYDSSVMHFMIDWKNPLSDQFIERLQRLRNKFPEKNLKVRIEPYKDNDLGSLIIGLNIEPHEDRSVPENYDKSSECKSIRDRFWEEVGKIADEMTSSQ